MKIHVGDWFRKRTALIVSSELQNMLNTVTPVLHESGLTLAKSAKKRKKAASAKRANVDSTLGQEDKIEQALLKLCSVWVLRATSGHKGRSKAKRPMPTNRDLEVWYKAAGSPKEFKPLFTKTTDLGPLPITVTEIGKRLRPLARALKSSISKGPEAKAWQEVQRKIGILGEQSLVGQFGDPMSTKPGKKAPKAEINRWLNDKLTIDIRAGLPTSKILQNFDRERGTDLAKQIPAAIQRRITFLDDGALLLDGQEIGSFKGQSLKIQRLAVPGSQIKYNDLQGTGQQKNNQSGGRGTRYVFSIQPATSKTPEYIYFLHHGPNSVKHQTRSLWSDADDLQTSLPKILKQITVDLSNSRAKDQPQAAVLAFVYLTACRIGGKGGTRQVEDKKAKKKVTEAEGGLGALTLQGSHIVKYQPGKLLHVKYSGKGQAGKDEWQEHVVTDKTSLGKSLLNWLKNQDIKKGSSTYLFSPKEDGSTRVPSSSVNGYLKRFTSATVHKFRKIRGTVEARRLLDSLKPTKQMTQKQVEEMFVSQMAKVGKLLGHYAIKDGKSTATGRTAISSYVDPRLMVNWFTDHGYKVPDLVRQAASKTGV